jgi:hypothetical protein
VETAANLHPALLVHLIEVVVVEGQDVIPQVVAELVDLVVQVS